MKHIPILLIIFRLTLAPVILTLAYTLAEQSRAALVILMHLGLLSDIFDGIIARRLNVSTAKLRRFDSQTDMIFWLSIGISSWHLHPDIIQDNKISVLIILIMEASCYVISIAKFGRETCTHAFLSKMFGLALVTAFTFLIGYGYAGAAFRTAVFLGIISHADRILITLLLPKWTHDVPSFYHAYLIRKGIEYKKNKLLN